MIASLSRRCREVDDGQRQGQLVRAGLGSRSGPARKWAGEEVVGVEELLRRDLALVAEPVEHVREAVAPSTDGPFIRWKCMCEALALPVLPSLAMTWPLWTLSPGLHQQGALLQVGVEGLDAIADVQDDVVAVHVLDGQLRAEHGIVGGQDAGRVGLMPVEGRDDGAVGHGVDGRP